VSSTSEHPKESAALAAWLTSPENQLAFCKMVNIMPSTPAVLSDPHFAPPSGEPGTAEYKLTLARSLSARAMPDAVAFTPSLGVWPDLRRAFNEGIKAALLNGEDTRRVLARIEDEWNQILDDALPATIDAVPRPGPVTAQSNAAHAEAAP
jgi:putative chitobiose transport system substrate-binding protein